MEHLSAMEHLSNMTTLLLGLASAQGVQKLPTEPGSGGQSTVHVAIAAPSAGSQPWKANTTKTNAPSMATNSGNTAQDTTMKYHSREKRNVPASPLSLKPALKKNSRQGEDRRNSLPQDRVTFATDIAASNPQVRRHSVSPHCELAIQHARAAREATSAHKANSDVQHSVTHPGLPKTIILYVL